MSNPEIYTLTYPVTQLTQRVWLIDCWDLESGDEWLHGVYVSEELAERVRKSLLTDRIHASIQSRFVQVKFNE